MADSSIFNKTIKIWGIYHSVILLLDFIIDRIHFKYTSPVISTAVFFILNSHISLYIMDSPGVLSLSDVPVVSVQNQVSRHLYSAVSFINKDFYISYMQFFLYYEHIYTPRRLVSLSSFCLFFQRGSHKELIIHSILREFFLPP